MDPALMLPNCLPGFESVNRFWDRRDQICMAKILPGEFYVSNSAELICTTLGSCVSACVWDPEGQIGGMNHFMLPETERAADAVGWSELPSSATRYGNYAMEHLINEIIKHGGHRKRLQAKVFGGSSLLGSNLNIGRGNIEFVLSYLQTDRIPIVASDLGDRHPRKLMFDPLSGRARVKLLRKLSNDTISSRESDYQQSINHQPVEGNIELF